MSNVLNSLKHNILFLLGSKNFTSKSLFLILVYIITNVPISVDFLGKINRLLKESED